MLEGEPLPRPPEAGLDLVEDEQRPGPVAEGPHRLQVAGRRRPHAALALDDLEQDGGQLPLEPLGLLLERPDVAVGHLPEARRHRLERRLLHRLAGGGQGRERGQEPYASGDSVDSVYEIESVGATDQPDHREGHAQKAVHLVICQAVDLDSA